MHYWSVLECCLQEIPIIVFLRATCTSPTSDLREPRRGHPFHIALKRFRIVVCENIGVIIVGSVGLQSCALCFLTWSIKSISFKVCFPFPL